MTRKSLFPEMVLLVLLFIALTLLPLFAHHAVAQECSPPGPCEPPPYEPPPSGGGSGGGSWSGYSDGRLNPSMDEYYTVWCRNDLIEVWGGVPTPQLINNIPIVDVLALGDVGSLDAGNGLTVSRSGDVVVVTGSNGNGPGPSSKVFSLTACTFANGGAPELPAQPNPPPQENPPPDDSAPPPAGAEDAVNDVWLCLPGSSSMADFLRCLNFFAPDSPSASYLYMISWAIATLCSGGMAPIALVAGVPVLHFWRRRRKK